MRPEAEKFREIAAAYRRLARRARTEGGFAALLMLADHMDADARRIDPVSERR
ncbi:hypothetical protein [Sphingomonas xanthus]|uniref:hypothetical protein n=1 Tax=Sphingomonas xanthus TaxID=2594473 RepID=UPI00164E9B45|nr:hypothetical protein [Sphingomonas xanthus]